MKMEGGGNQEIGLCEIKSGEAHTKENGHLNIRAILDSKHQGI